MESITKSFDVNEVLAGVEKSLEKYESVDSDNIIEDAKLYRPCKPRLSVVLLIFLNLF